MANSTLIIGLGKNIGASSSQEDIRNSDDFLSLESRITTDAAGLLYEAYGGDADILFCGGHTAGKDILAESDAMRVRLLSRFLINPDHAFADKLSCDTRTNAKEILNWTANRPPYDQITLLSVGFHIVNATKLIRRFGVKIDHAYASEDIVRQRSEEDEKLITEWLGSSAVKKEVRREKKRTVLLHTVDPYGLILHPFAKLSRA